MSAEAQSLRGVGPGAPPSRVCTQAARACLRLRDLTGGIKNPMNEAIVMGIAEGRDSDVFQSCKSIVSVSCGTEVPSSACVVILHPAGHVA